MTTPANYPLNIRIGDTETISLTIAEADGTPINVAGRTYAAQIRLMPESPDVIAAFTCSVIGDGSTGQVTCTLSSTVTAALSPGTGVFDLQETNGSAVTTLIAGSVFIVQDVTR